jgi:hypothetical protein
VAHAYILTTLEAEMGRINSSRANSSQDPISKITRAKWTEGVIQAVKCLLCKHEALSSNPNPTKKKKINHAYWMEPS